MLIFNDITDTNNPLDLAYCVKGQIYAAEHNPECYTYFSKAIQMKPNDSLPYMYRAKASFDDGKIDQAINDFKMVIRLSPANAYVHKCLADAEIKKGNYFNAIDQCNEAIKIDSNCFSAFDQLAWIQAACPDPKIRDGKTALVNAKKACDLAAWKNAQSLETLAAAYAETGDFKQAVAWEQKAIDLGLKDSKERLELYKQNRPFRFEASLGK
jgi:tetratricopeptide (TPR) repeat protein